MKKVLISLMFMLQACNQADIAAPTVMITNKEGNSGGSGVVLESGVLTNAHVCGIFKKFGSGVVRTENNKSFDVTEYSLYKKHDLCLIKVAGNMDIKPAKLSDRKPKLYENATISGHPALYPIVMSHGHFSHSTIIKIFVGSRECTDDDWDNEDSAAQCNFFGSLPILQSFDSMLVTATIMPGSSGSAVYNSNNEVSALVFAGMQSLSYAFIVPYEYVMDFMSQADKDFVKPAIGKESSVSLNKEKLFVIKKSCDNLKPDSKIIIRDMCRIIVRDLQWRETL